MKEHILCAAVKYNGQIISGYRHNDCWELLESLIGEVNGDLIDTEIAQGFLTSDKRYVSRAEAWIIAEDNNQIVHGYKSGKFPDDGLRKTLGITSEFEPLLMSENLY